MASWARNNPWRQGSILPPDAAKALGLQHPDGAAETIVLVVSHDCDLAQGIEVEPECEVIVGCTIDEIDGNHANAKNPRRLHLTFGTGDVTLFGDFLATEKKSIRKEALADFAPAGKVGTSPGDLQILQSWLAVRYRRSSFSDEFDRRLKDSAAYDKFQKAIKATGNNLLDVLFDVDLGREITRNGPDDTYALSIFLVVNVEEDFAAAEASAKQAATAIQAAFRLAFFKDRKWQNIELRNCLVVSEAAMTVNQQRMLKPWSFDYLSLRTEPKGDITR